MKGKPITEWNCEANEYMKVKEKAIEMFVKYLKCRIIWQIIFWLCVKSE